MRTLSACAVSLAILASVPAHAADLAAVAACNISPARAAELGCVCVNSLVAPVAVLDQVTGDVVRTTLAGYTPVPNAPPGPPSALAIGDRVLFSANGQGHLVAGACQAVVGPSVTMLVKQVEGACACMALVQERVVAPLVAPASAIALALLLVPIIVPVSP